MAMRFVSGRSGFSSNPIDPRSVSSATTLYCGRAPARDARRPRSCCRPSRARIRVLGEAEVEEVVAGDDEHVLAGPALAVRDERDVADRAEAVLIRRRPSSWTCRAVAAPSRKSDAKRAFVTRCTSSTSFTSRILSRIRSTIGLAGDRKQRLCPVVRQRTEPGCVTPGEDERLHAVRTGQAADTAVAARAMAGVSPLPWPLQPRSDQVPSSHEARYFACSSVSLSMSTPIVSSFSRAISRSISSGTT